MGEIEFLRNEEDPDVERTSHARPGRTRLVVVAFALLILASAVLTALRSPYFEVERVEVHGTRELATEQVVMLCGLGPRVNIFDVDLARLAERVMADPMVDKAVATRRLPSTIVVEVVERTPVAVLPYAGYYVRVDGRGVAIGLVESYRDKALPLLTGLSVNSVELGREIDAPDIDQALDVVRALPQDILDEVSEVNFQPEEGFSVCLTGGTRVVLGTGTADEFASRLGVLQAILRGLGGREDYPAYVDVRYEKRPVVRARR